MESFDPEDWEEFKQLSHRMVDEMLEFQRTLPAQPAWRDAPQAVRDRISQDTFPVSGIGEEAAFQSFLDNVLPYSNGNLGPRFFGWVQGNGMPLAMMSEMLASGLNPHMAGFNQAPKLVEEKVVDWLREAMEFPPGTSGILMSGGSMASTCALAIARRAKAGFDVRQNGLWGRPVMAVYVSSQTHSWAKKAAEFLGMGRKSLRIIPVLSDFTMDLAALREQIKLDRNEGLQPIGVLATAGTVNTGATDDLNAIADLCEQEQLWMHVDGAFGALAKLSPTYRHKVEGLERADSLAFDLHKWMYMPFEIACLLVRDGAAHRDTFSQEASYISSLDRGVMKGGVTFGDLGMELTRNFKALKAWMCLKAYGLDKFGRVIEQNIDLAQRLKSLVQANPELDLLAEVPLNIVCYRYRGNCPEAELDDLNREILYALQEQGLAVPSSTIIGGQFALRVCIVNHRTTEADIVSLVDHSVEFGRALSD